MISYVLGQSSTRIVLKTAAVSPVASLTVLHVMMQGGSSWTDVEDFYRHNYQVDI